MKYHHIIFRKIFYKIIIDDNLFNYKKNWSHLLKKIFMTIKVRIHYSYGREITVVI
jgi:hypothetical protein